MVQDSPWIIDADVRNFETDVIQRSLEVPVLVDFWADWCGPCKTLTPALEKRARDGNGRFVLAKVDLDRNPELAQAFRVQTVPTVLALLGGKLVDGFQGALGDVELDAFLDKIVPPGDTPEPSAVAQAEELAEAGDVDAAVALLQTHLGEQPEDNAARMCLAEQLINAGNAAEARAAFDELPDAEKGTERARTLAARLSFAETSGDVQELLGQVEKNPEDGAARTALGRAYVGQQDYEQGLENLLEAVRIGNRNHEMETARDEARGVMLEVFEILGLEDPVANDYRFKLSLEIFA